MLGTLPKPRAYSIRPRERIITNTPISRVSAVLYHPHRILHIARCQTAPFERSLWRCANLGSTVLTTSTTEPDVNDRCLAFRVPIPRRRMNVTTLTKKTGKLAVGVMFSDLLHKPYYTGGASLREIATTRHSRTPPPLRRAGVICLKLHERTVNEHVRQHGR